MPRENRSFAKLYSAAIFIALEIAALSLLSSSSTLQNIWLNKASHRTMAKLWGWGEDTRSYLSLKEQNQQLSRENSELISRLQAYDNEKSLREAARNAPAKDKRFNYIPASIVKMSRNSQRGYVILDKGSADGVLPEDGVITPSGVIGMVEAVDEHYCYALTLMNINMKVGVKIGNSGVSGPLSWDGRSTDRAFVHELPLHFEVSRGDTVRTSGYSAIYPPNIPIGTTGSSKIVNGSTRDLEVFMFQDFSTINNVIIVHNTGYEEIRNLEL